jgi:hypothetical protein
MSTFTSQVEQGLTRMMHSKPEEERAITISSKVSIYDLLNYLIATDRISPDDQKAWLTCDPANSSDFTVHFRNCNGVDVSITFVKPQ